MCPFAGCICAWQEALGYLVVLQGKLNWEVLCDDAELKSNFCSTTGAASIGMLLEIIDTN